MNKIYYPLECNFNIYPKIESINKLATLKSFINEISSQYQFNNQNYFFWKYDSHNHAIIVNDNTSYVTDDIYFQLNFINNWLLNNNYYLVGFFYYRTNKKMELITIFNKKINNYVLNKKINIKLLKKYFGTENAINFILTDTYTKLINFVPETKKIIAKTKINKKSYSQKIHQIIKKHKFTPVFTKKIIYKPFNNISNQNNFSTEESYRIIKTFQKRIDILENKVLNLKKKFNVFNLFFLCSTVSYFIYISSNKN